MNPITISMSVLLVLGVAAIIIPKYNPILKIGLLVVLVIILREIAVTNSPRLGIHPLSAFSVSTPIIGMITFFGFMWLAHREEGRVAVTKGGMQLAIVVAVVTVYLVIASSVAFFTADVKVAPIADLFIQQFNLTVGTILVFYLGASAYAGAQLKKDQDENKDDAKKKR